MNTSSENLLSIDLVPQDSEPALWAKAMVRANHYLHRTVDPRERIDGPVRINLRDVLPGSALFYGVNVAVRDAIIISYFLEGFPLGESLPNFRDLFSGELGDWRVIANASPCYSSPLGGAICVVFCERTKPQVMGIDAGGHVALVTHCHSFRDWSLVNRVAESMRHDVAPVFRNGTVSPTVFSASPQPAFIVAALVYVAPKLFQKRTRANSKATVTGDVLQRLAFDPSQSLSIAIRDGCLLPTAAHAKAARVRAVDLQIFALVVTRKEPRRVSLAVSLGEIRTILDGGKFTTTALAIAVWLNQAMFSNPRCVFVKVCGIVGSASMIGHVDTFLSRFRPCHRTLLRRGGAFVDSPHLYSTTKSHESPHIHGLSFAIEPNWTWQDLTDINPRTMRMF